MSRLPVLAGAPGRKGGSGKYAFHAGIAGIWTMTIVGGIRSYLHDGGRVFSEPTFLTAILLALSLAAIGAGSGVLLGCLAILIRKRRAESRPVMGLGRA